VRTLESMADDTFPSTLPKCLAWATSMSGWRDMYVQKKPDLSATGSAMMEGETNWTRSLGHERPHP